VLVSYPGFPDWRYLGKYGINTGRKLEIEPEPGTYYSYSGEGIQLLQPMAEEVTKKGLEELTQEHVFQPFDMSMTSFVWQDRYDKHFAVGHYKKKKTTTRVKRGREYGNNSQR
jgi:CubicO group peptidase (beta-lactamase class C family)